MSFKSIGQVSDISEARIISGIVYDNEYFVLIDNEIHTVLLLGDFVIGVECYDETRTKIIPLSDMPDKQVYTKISDDPITACVRTAYGYDVFETKDVYIIDDELWVSRNDDCALMCIADIKSVSCTTHFNEQPQPIRTIDIIDEGYINDSSTIGFSWRVIAQLIQLGRNSTFMFDGKKLTINSNTTNWGEIYKAHVDGRLLFISEYAYLLQGKISGMDCYDPILVSSVYIEFVPESKSHTSEPFYINLVNGVTYSSIKVVNGLELGE